MERSESRDRQRKLNPVRRFAGRGGKQSRRRRRAISCGARWCLTRHGL